MKLVKSLLLGSAAGLTVAGGAQAADLPVKKAVPIEYVRVCTAYGAGFFYIPGTDTCLRVSGRARFEAGYNSDFSRNGPGNGDLSQFRSLLRINLDARTQTDYGTLRAFVRLEAASRTGQNKMASGTQARIGNAFFGIGQDAYGRVQNYIVTEKAFIQFAGLTAGRASSFFDFYAHDFEIIGSSLGSDLPSTNLLAYTQKFGGGFSATLSMEDPNFRKNPLYSSATQNAALLGSSTPLSILTTAPAPIILGTNAAGNATAVAFIDAVQRSRMPDFVGSLRYDAPWGSAQISGAVKDINTGGFIAGSGITSLTGAANTAVTPLTVAALLATRGINPGAQTEYGWAVQGGVKINTPWIAPGDGLYLQGAYGVGANNYTGITSYAGTYTTNTNIAGGNPFNQWLADAIINPLTGKLELAESFTVVGSYLHYWAPQWRSAFYGSYGEVAFSKAARQAVSQTSSIIGGSAANSPPSYLLNVAGYNLSPALRDNNIIVAGASLIWSPVKDLDIGVEGQYIRLSQNSGRSTNADKNVNVGGLPLYPVGTEETIQARFRVQRDF